MPSASSRPRRSSSNDHREEFARLLQDGAVFPEPSAALVAAADRLTSLGLIAVQRSSYVVCADPRERDFRFLRNRACQGRIVLRPGADEAENAYRCPACDRVVYPERYGKRARPELRVAVQAGGVLSYVRSEIAKLGVEVDDVAAGVFRVDLGGMGVVVCLVDYCDAAKYVSQQWALMTPTCYVTIDPAHAAEGFLVTWTTKAALAEIVADVVNLGTLVRRLAAEGTPTGVVPESPRVHSRPVAPVKIGEPAVQAPGRRFVVEVSKETIRVEGIEVVAPQAGTRLEVFRILWNEFLDDLREGRSPEDFTLLTIEAIVGRLEKKTGKRVDDVDTVGRALRRLRDDMATAVRKELGLPIDGEDLIENRSGAGAAEGASGYRVNPRCVCTRPFQTSPSA
jgi:hypothetical protein